MSHAMAGADETWAWLDEPLQQFSQNTDRPWEDRRRELVDRLGLTAPDQHPVVFRLFAQLDELDESTRDRVVNGDELAALAFEIVQQETAAYQEQPAEPADPGQPGTDQVTGTDTYDESAWYAYAGTNLAQWNGDEQTWDQFRDWFLYYATEQGLRVPAEAFLDHADGRSTEEKIATFAQYGVVVAPPVAEPAAEEPADLPALDEEGEVLMTEILAANPELARLPEAHRRELLLEVMAEQEAGR